MEIKARNKQEINKYILSYANRIEQALIFQLEVLVAQLENHAKLSAGYKDRTSNLKSSIGGVVLNDGKVITYKGFKGRQAGTTTGLEFINSLIGQFTKGYVIILVAGMNYASYVENFYGLNVLKKTELKMQTDLRKMLAAFKKKIEK